MAPPKFEVKRELLQRTDRVKGVDLHPTEPWLLGNLYNGNVYIWSTTEQTLVKSFEVCDLPVRTAKFVARKQWVITGADDMLVRVYNYNTMDKVKVFEAHTDYIRCIAVHPTLPAFLTCSDDTLIKLWDWDKGFNCTQIFEGHSHFVMQVIFNPKDTNTFASASLDHSVKVWSLGQPMPNFTLEGHDKGVNCVDYFQGGDRPYLITGSDDKLVKIWDYQTKACVQTLEGHLNNISAACFHPELPLIITGSEDGTVKLWHGSTYRLENTLDFRMERVWSVGVCKGSNCIAIGYDEGAVMIKVGKEEPVASMDASGKVIWAKHSEIQTVNIKSLGADYEMADGERLPLAVKDLGSSDAYPQSLQHNPNGRFVTVCGDGEFVVYTALAWRNKAFGHALEFAWSADSNEYVVRESVSRVKVFKNFAEKLTLKVDFAAEGIHGGHLISVRSSDFIVFYDWDGNVVRRIDVAAKNVLWSESGENVAVVGDSSFYLLQYNADVVAAAGTTDDPDGIDDAFELLNEISEVVRTALWVGECFIYSNSSWRLNYCVGGEITTMCHLDRPMYLLGYLAQQSRVFLIDKEFSLMSYTLLLSMIELKTLVMRGDVAGALALLPNVPAEQHNGVARFLESKGHAEHALSVATDPHYRFDLAVQLGDLATAESIAEALDSATRWKQLGELAMSSGRLGLGETCLRKAADYSGLMLLFAAQGNRAGLSQLTADASEGGKHNVAFLALFLLGRTEHCLQLLLKTGRLPEAAFFARTYLPSRMSEVTKVWKKDLERQNPKAAESLADPSEYPNLFPDLEWALKAEQLQTALLSRDAPASDQYAAYEGSTLRNMIELAQEAEASGSLPAAPPPVLASPAKPAPPPAAIPAPAVVAAPTMAVAAFGGSPEPEEEEEEVEQEDEEEAEEEEEEEEEEAEEDEFHEAEDEPSSVSQQAAFAARTPPDPVQAPVPAPETKEVEEEEEEEVEEDELFAGAADDGWGAADAAAAPVATVAADDDEDDWGLDDDDA
mmetsp:Transcript_31650/g.94312  ORF Transcript_31650/g.94312 Transcript_31650/m.94312 type:complete len:1010 (-) Transcript_31650:167-3196(-)